MFEDRTYNRTFYSGPQSVTSLVAAFLEPGITVLVFFLAMQASGEFMDRPALTLCLLVFALTFPGPNRFRDNLLNAAVDILSSWLTLIAILALCAYATRSFHFFEDDVLLGWVLLTPIVQWIAVWIGKTILRIRASQPGARTTAVVVGAGALGVKVSRAISESADRGIDFVGYFDDRSDGRIHPEATSRILGGLKDVAAHVREHFIREVYITLPLGSQPRIVELLEQVQGTTASLYFVPDVFGISIIQGGCRT